MNQTPARRFLRPTSSSTQKSSTDVSTREMPRTGSQFRFHSSTGSHRAASTRFETPVGNFGDDIDTSFGDRDSSPLPSSKRPSGTDDAIDDGFDLSETAMQNVLPSPIGFDEDSLVNQSHSSEPCIEEQSPEIPLKVVWGHATQPHGLSRKRRKIMPTENETSKAPIFVSSSPEEMLADYSSQDELQSNDPVRMDDDLLDRDDFVKPALSTPKMNTRFKSAILPISDDRPQMGKHVFRNTPYSSHIAPEMTAVLPETFSPSRRKGKVEYKPGGLADTVRNWVLQAATLESQTREHKDKNIKVQHWKRDRTGKAVLILSSKGEQWLLPGSSQQIASFCDPSKSAEEKTVVIKGEATSWYLPVDEDLDVSRSIKFAALWESSA